MEGQAPVNGPPEKTATPPPAVLDMEGDTAVTAKSAADALLMSINSNKLH
jgi:hypothetical protein